MLFVHWDDEDNFSAVIDQFGTKLTRFPQGETDDIRSISIGLGLMTGVGDQKRGGQD